MLTTSVEINHAGEIFEGTRQDIRGVFHVHLFSAHITYIWTIYILRNHIFRIFGPPTPLRKHVFSTENNQKLAFSEKMYINDVHKTHSRLHGLQRISACRHYRNR